MERALELAGFFAAHGVWCLAEGETLIPLLAFQRQDGKQEFRRIEVDELQEAVVEGKKWLADNPDNVACAVLVYDAYISLPGGKTDCLMLEIRSYEESPRSLSVAVPYRHAGHSESFGVHRPKFFAGPEDEGNVSEFGEAFFRGVAQHEKGSFVWNARLDETR